jgi:hypothetical protein
LLGDEWGGNEGKGDEEDGECVTLSAAKGAMSAMVPLTWFRVTGTPHTKAATTAGRAMCVCTKLTAIAPSPTAEAQRFTDPLRTSPAAKTPGRLVSSSNGGRQVACERL